VCGPRGASLQVTATAQPIQSGMSGSPILDADGDAIGAVSTGEGIFPNPRLLGALPGWFLAKAVKGAAFARQLQTELVEAARSRRR
jgi:hypothetical protein